MLDMLRRKRVDGTPVLWQGCYGRAYTVVARRFRLIRGEAG